MRDEVHQPEVRRISDRSVGSDLNVSQLRYAS
jgi:hypothetical protein